MGSTTFQRHSFTICSPPYKALNCVWQTFFSDFVYEYFASGLQLPAGVVLNQTSRKFGFDYLLKNIALPTKDIYERRMIDKIDNVIRQMRCENYFLEHGKRNSKKLIWIKIEESPAIGQWYEAIRRWSYVKDGIYTISKSQWQIPKFFLQQLKENYITTDLSFSCFLTQQETSMKPLPTQKQTTEKWRDKNLKFKRQEIIAMRCRLINPANSESDKVSKVFSDDIGLNIRHLTKSKQVENFTESNWMTLLDQGQQQILYYNLCIISLISTHLYLTTYKTKSSSRLIF